MSENYTGYSTIQITDSKINELYKKGHIDFPDNRFTWYPASYIELISNENDKHTALGKIKNNRIELVKPEKLGKIKSRNREQVFAIDALLDPDIDLVVLTGHFGGGKTILSLGAGLQAIEDQKYKKLILSKPMTQIGKHPLGILPGPQPLDAKIAIPNGWTEMGKLQLGDLVFAKDGTPVKVIGIYPREKEENIFKITTSDGTSTECTLDHLWFTTTAEQRKRGKIGSVKTTLDIINSFYRKATYGKGKNKLNHCLPRNGAVQYDKKEYKISPYVLGALIGDGSFSNHIQFSNIDKEIIDKVSIEIESLGCDTIYQGRINYGFKNKKKTNNKPARLIRITDLDNGKIQVFNRIGEAIQKTGLSKNNLNSWCSGKKIVDNKKYEFLEKIYNYTNLVKDEICKLGLLNKKAWEKFIPDIYKYGSIQDRLELLRGLMDTDGTVKKSTGEASFATTSLQLALDVIELVRSLGGRATLCQRDRVGQINCLNSNHTIITKRISYEFSISLPEEYNPFYVSRKNKYYKRRYIHENWIQSIEYIGKKKVQCILIDHPEHLYLTDNFIVTHNTTEDKLRPFLVNYESNLTQIVGDDVSIDDIVEQYHIEFRPIQLFLGASFANTFLIIDEAANLEVKDIGALLSRAGENCKVVIMGDHKQIHDKIEKKNEGLRKLVNDKRIKESPFCAVIELQKCERSRLATLIGDIFGE